MIQQKLVLNIRAIKIIILVVTLLFTTAVLHAQDDDANDALRKKLFITGSAANSLPGITLQTYATAEDGSSMPLSADMLTAHHNGLAATVDSVSSQEVGTLTIFLVDVPPGVADQIPAIQNAILQYATPGNMKEQVDYVSIYKAGETGAIELLAPDFFHNSVRNLFADPLQPETGVTALNDSSIDLLNQMESLKPKADMVASLVIISDGTDATSTNQMGDVPALAADLSIPLHTLWLDNADLSDGGKVLGQDNLHEWATNSGGFSFELNDLTGLAAIWDRIADFRNQLRVTYITELLTAGEANAELALVADGDVGDETAVFIAETAPILAITLPADERTLTLPSVEKPTSLHFNSTLSWVDGEERAIEAAHLVVNNISQPIPTDSVTSFDADVENLFYGQNRVHIAILDELGTSASSPDILLTVTEGDKAIPDSLQPSGGAGAIVTGFLWLLLLAGIGTAVYFAWKKELFKNITLPNLPSRPRRGKPSPKEIIIPPAEAEEVVEDKQEMSDETMPLYRQEETPDYPPVNAIGYIEILASETANLPSEYALHGAEIKIGRSPTQADIIFENDPSVSRLHVLLVLENGRYRLYDQNSSAGAWVNDQRVPAYGLELMSGDEIHLGAVHLRFRHG